jgi:hypothetical protein
MALAVHFVGSIGLDTVNEVFSTVGRMIGPSLRRLPDGEVAGRRQWIQYQFPLLTSMPFLERDPESLKGGYDTPGGYDTLKLVDGVKPEEIHFGELGYAREARISYQDFVRARDAGAFPATTRFQVSLPTPFAILLPKLTPAARPVVEPAYEQAMIREVEAICAAIPHKDLAIQWDVAFELIIFDGGKAVIRLPTMPDAGRKFAERLARISAAVPSDVELGIHLCYGGRGEHNVLQPEDSGKMVEFANLLMEAIAHPVGFIHMPVPQKRDDDAYFAPLSGLKSGPELYLGLVHIADGVDGALRRIRAARKVAPEFGIASDCGIARARSKERVLDILSLHAEVAKVGAS